jgi:hypothetical protein
MLLNPYVAMFTIAVCSKAKRNFSFSLYFVFIDILQMSGNKHIFPLCNRDAVFFFEVVTTCSYIV